ncbi:unnamed protein product [Aureobasidium uvarum]|uniref:Uncharacterized protein n=1 Tax=Aureobasidium uvarum TaxID=2773716 RepID=A0A9N8KAN2_9PEZI|nr:unnamed protein product [Aureobasidium uvarum]
MVGGEGMYLRDDGRNREGHLVTPDDPADAPQAAAVEASAPGGVYDERLSTAPLSLWRSFTSPSVFLPTCVSGTPFLSAPSAGGRAPARWQDFVPEQSGVAMSLTLRQLSSSETAEERMGDANGVGSQEKDDDDSDGEDEEMSEEDEEDEEEGKGQTAKDMSVPKRRDGHDIGSWSRIEELLDRRSQSRLCPEMAESVTKAPKRAGLICTDV